MKINLVDSTFSHCEVSSNPLPIINKAKYIQWVRKDSTNETVIYTDSNISSAVSSKAIAWLIEPEEIKPAGYNFIRNNYKKFESIWTYDRELLNTIPNATFYPFGGCWIEDNDRVIHKKTKTFSIISSNKKQTIGHKLRHQIISKSNNKIDVFGVGYVPIKNKTQGLQDYRYHFVIENVRKDYWFTEKLIDSFITGTIPIYWGCPSIGDFFNTDGMIIFNDLIELQEKLKKCTEKFYNDRLDVIKENFDLAKKYTLAEDWIYNNIISND